LVPLQDNTLISADEPVTWLADPASGFAGADASIDTAPDRVCPGVRDAVAEAAAVLLGFLTSKS
jgi:hypothetical protein